MSCHELTINPYPGPVLCSGNLHEQTTLFCIQLLRDIERPGPCCDLTKHFQHTRKQFYVALSPEHRKHYRDTLTLIVDVIDYALEAFEWPRDHVNSIALHQLIERCELK